MHQSDDLAPSNPEVELDTRLLQHLDNNERLALLQSVAAGQKTMSEVLAHAKAVIEERTLASSRDSVAKEEPVTPPARTGLVRRFSFLKVCAVLCCFTDDARNLSRFFSKPN
eukprot:m.82682 g.82682  ORF g.82682 m.82682 type:complete len:112 (+) comp14313_c1_seq1:244-579(+)